MSQRVRITDVSPRDGLQNEAGVIPASGKTRLVELLGGTGVDEIEVSSFVSAKWIPQLGDAAEVFRAAAAFKPAGLVYSALVPNERGLVAALQLNAESSRRVIDKVSVFTAASETFARKNTNASIVETLERFRPVIHGAHAAGLSVRGYVSCVIACPFEGPIAPAAVASVAQRLVELGVDELDLGDTIGAGTPETTRAMLQTVDAVAPISDTKLPVTLHFHDTFGRAAACVRTALEQGVRSFDGSVAGLGGCPYAGTPGRRAPGNISTELLVGTIHDAGYTTAVDVAALAEAARFARQIVDAARTSAGAGA